MHSLNTTFNSFSTGNPQILFLLFFHLLCDQKVEARISYFGNKELGSVQLIEYALILSGTENNLEVSKIYQKLVEDTSFIKREPLRTVQALNLLKYLHREFLLFYNYEQTKLNILLREKIYNCVSLSLLYVALLRELEFKAYLLGDFEHTRVAVKLSEKDWLLVETTDKSVTTWQKTDKLKEKLLTDNQSLALILKNLLFIAQEKKQDLQVFLSLQKDLANLSGLKEDYNNLFELQVAFSLEKYAEGGIFETLNFLNRALETHPVERLKEVRSKFIYNEIITKLNDNQPKEARHLYSLLALKMLPQHLQKIIYILNYK